MIIEGGVSVKAAMLGGRRQVEQIMLDRERHDRDARFIVHQAERQGIKVVRCDRQEIDAFAAGRTHGGVIAETGPRQWQELPDLLCGIPFAVLLEGVEDPFNLGYVIRSLYSAGCTGLILRQRDWQRTEPVILKSSAGAFEYLPVILSDDPAKAVQYCRDQGLKSYAAMRKDAVSYFEVDYRQPVLIAIGGEMRGLSAGVLANCEQNIYIPYANDFRNALNAAGAAAALGFEVLRQRTYGTGTQK